MIDRVKGVDSLDGLLLDGARLGEPVEGTDTGREVVERCEVRQIAAVAAEHDLTQVNQAVYGLLDGGEDPRRRPLPMFHLSPSTVLATGENRDRIRDANRRGWPFPIASNTPSGRSSCRSAAAAVHVSRY